MRTLLLNGHVYSLAENFATALLAEDGVIAWIGSEGGAQVHRQDVDEVVDLGGDLLTPGFVNLDADEVNWGGGFVHAQQAAVPVADRWSGAQYDGHGGSALAVVPRPPCQLRSRIAAGLPTALVPADPHVSGWQTVRDAIHGVADEQRLTARAAFNALTRGAWRLLDRAGRGALIVGAEATFVRWAASDLVVQTPDERISNWSTDPRSAIPGLPPLDPGQDLPSLVAVWVAGNRR